MDEKHVQTWLAYAAQRLAIPGVAAGVYHAGQYHYAVEGVTNVGHPLPVHRDTLAGIGSTGKTFTATAMARLIDQGDVDLHAPVRRYLPEFRVRDAGASSEATIMHLLNHTAGWEGDLDLDTGDGDDALARYVDAMADLDQHLPVGAGFIYSNASFCLAGRVIENLTGRPFERAIQELLLDPLELRHTAYLPKDIMTHRFSVGHTYDSDRSVAVIRPLIRYRSGHPAGVGLASSVVDQLSWARFHLGDGKAANGSRLLSEQLLTSMRQATVETPGGAQADAVGLGWMLRDVDGTRLVSHGGDSGGHHSAFVMVPEHDFACTLLTNGPDGPALRAEFVRWALESYLGVVDRPPESERRDEGELARYIGAYETSFLRLTVTVGDGGLRLRTVEKRMQSDGVVDTFPELGLGMLPGPGDRYVVTEGVHEGLTGYFTRDAANQINGLHFSGRMAILTGSAGRKEQ